MALYTFSKGSFERLPLSGGEFLLSRVFQQASLDDTLGGCGFYRHDDVCDVYTVYRRQSGSAAHKWMPAIHWVFAVQTHDDDLDFILVEDSLPDYLGALREFQVLVDRAVRRAGETGVDLGGKP